MTNRRTNTCINQLGATIARCFLIGALLAGVVACASVEPAAYVAGRPRLDLKSYFNGTLDAWGMFTDGSGKVVKRFTVVIRCSWQGDVGTFDEAFTYSDGSRQQRIWSVRKNGDRYVGTAADVIGEALGEAGGNVLNWRYVLALPVDGKVYNVDFDDWMVLIDERVMLNRAAMSKFGWRLGEVTLSFTKR